MIRTATPEDVPQIVELASRSLVEGPYSSMFADDPNKTAAIAAQLLAQPNSEILVADEGGKLVGLFAFTIGPNYYSGQVGATEMIWYVSPEGRPGGNGMKLKWEAENKAKEMGAQYMALGAPTPETEAMYAHLSGYRKVETMFLRAL